MNTETGQILWGMPIERWWTSMISMIPNLVAALVVVVLTWMFARTVSRVVSGFLSAVTPNARLTRVVAGSASGLVLVIGLSIVLTILGLESASTTLVVLASVAGLLVAIGARDISANFLAWIVLTLRSPFEDGDYIEVGEYAGKVAELNPQATVVTTGDGGTVIIPNRDVVRTAVLNWTTLGKRRVRIGAMVPTDAHLDRVRAAIEDALSDLPLLDTAREIEIDFGDMGPAGLELEVAFWMDYRNETEVRHTRSDAAARVHTALQQAQSRPTTPLRKSAEVAS